MYAVIQTGGKQYRVKEGDVLSVEKLDFQAGHKVDFDRVLLLEDEGGVQLGTPVLPGAAVRAEIVENYKDEKVLVFKKKRRKQYRRTRGHRQQLTKVRIERIVADRTVLPAIEPVLEKPLTEPVSGAAPAAKKAEPKAPRPKAERAARPAAKPKAAAKKPAAAKPAPKARKTTKE